MAFIVHCVLTWACVFLPLSMAHPLRVCCGKVALAMLSLGLAGAIISGEIAQSFSLVGAEWLSNPLSYNLLPYQKLLTQVALSVILLTATHLLFQALWATVEVVVELSSDDNSNDIAGAASLLTALLSIALWLQLDGHLLLPTFFDDQLPALEMIASKGRVVSLELLRLLSPVAGSLLLLKLFAELLTIVGFRLGNSPDFAVERISVRIGVLVLGMSFVSSIWTVENVDALRRRLTPIVGLVE